MQPWHSPPLSGLLKAPKEPEPKPDLCPWKRRFGGRAEIIEADMLDFALGTSPHHVVANVPFALTTPLLRRLLQQTTWDSAVLLLQWEVARNRAGVGGTTMLTANWWPWYEFSLVKRVPAAAFVPRPSVDGGILQIHRREAPLVVLSERGAYQELVRAVFTGRGRGLPAILRAHLPERSIREWMARESLDQASLPRDLKAEQWASLLRERATRPEDGLASRDRDHRPAEPGGPRTWRRRV